MNARSFASILVSSIILNPSLLYAQHVCEAFAKYGIYDTQTSTSDTDKASSFRSWFCQSKFESKESADSASLSLGYKGFNLGFDSNRESWSQFSSNYCRDDTYNARYRQATTSFIRTINATALNNMRDCFNRKGLHVRVIPGARPDTFYFQAKMNPSGTVTSAEITAFSVVGGTCRGPLGKGYVVTSAGAEQICQRVGNEAVDISLSAREEVNWDSPRGLNKNIVPPPVPEKELVTIRAQDFVRGTNVAIDQCVVGPGILANAPPCNDRENAAEFDFSVKAAGAYRLDIYFTAAASRPTKVILNKEVVRDQALSENTGSWLNTHLRWTEIGKVRLLEGSNTIRLERQGVFPHINQLRLVPIQE